MEKKGGYIVYNIFFLNIYIVYDIIMAIIEFILDENNEQQVLNVLNSLNEDAKGDKEIGDLYGLIIRGFKFLQKHGIPAGTKELMAKLAEEDETPYSIRLIKELRHHPPLYEFRINWRGAGAFRAILFEHPLDGDQLLVFTRAIIKQTTTSRDFEKIINESEQLLQEFNKNPEKYLKGVDQIDRQE